MRKVASRHDENQQNENARGNPLTGTNREDDSCNLETTTERGGKKLTNGFPSLRRHGEEPARESAPNKRERSALTRKRAP